MALHKRIQRRKIHEQVAEELANMIVSGELSAGQALPSERDIMEMFGVGRTSVREALLALQKSGVVTVRNGERARIVDPSFEVIVGELSTAARVMLSKRAGIENFQAARMLFEIGIARDVARNASDEGIRRLEAALADNRDAIGDQARFQATDMAFHSCLVDMAANPIFSALDYAFREWLEEQRRLSAAAGVHYDNAYAGHARIYSAIVDRDAERAQQEMEDHLKLVARYFWIYKDEIAEQASVASA